MKKRKFKTLKLSSKDYPVNLGQITKPPEKIYLLGDIEFQDQVAIAVIGTRNPSDKGKQLATEFSDYLASAGATIVSGMARGIDTIAHRAALKAGGRTIAVLGSGIDIIYPPENKELYEEIVNSGAVISEFPPGTAPEGPNFLIRNRLISGLSLAVVVIEGNRRSGTLSTAAKAANQGREVFAIPGSPAADYLIAQGVTACARPEEVLDYVVTSFQI